MSTEKQQRQWAREVKKRAYTVKNTCDKNAGEYRAIISVEYKSADTMTEIINELTNLTKLRGDVNTAADFIFKEGGREMKYNMTSMVNLHEGRILDTWSEITVLENELFALQTRGVLVSEEYRRGLEETQKKADKIKKETAKREKLTDTERDKYHIILDDIVSRSNLARRSFEALLSGNSMIREFNEMHKNRNTLVTQLREELKDLRAYEKEMKKTVEDIYRSMNRHT